MDIYTIPSLDWHWEAGENSKERGRVNKAKKTKDLPQAETSDDGNKGAPALVDIHPETKAGNWSSMDYNQTWQARFECRKPAPISRTWPRANRSAYNTELSRANHIGALLSAAPPWAGCQSLARGTHEGLDKASHELGWIHDIYMRVRAEGVGGLAMGCCEKGGESGGQIGRYV